MDQQTASTVEMSIVIPAHNEEDVIAECLREIVEVLRPLGRPYEVIVVDDGSTDRTINILRALKGEIPELVILRLDRNHGQTAAFEAGLKNVRGRVVVTMDADMQNDPRDIPRLLEGLDKWDVVCGVRQKRQDSLVRRISSRVANWTRNKLTGDTIRDVGCSLRAFKADCVKDLQLYTGMHRFLPTLFKFDGWSITEVPVNRRPRIAGKTHYGIGNRLFTGLRDIFAVRWMKSRWLRYRIEEKLQ